MQSKGGAAIGAKQVCQIIFIIIIIVKIIMVIVIVVIVIVIIIITNHQAGITTAPVTLSVSNFFYFQVEKTIL